MLHVARHWLEGGVFAYSTMQFCIVCSCDSGPSRLSVISGGSFPLWPGQSAITGQDRGGNKTNTNSTPSESTKATGSARLQAKRPKQKTVSARTLAWE